MKITATQVRSINSISRKVSFSQTQLTKYFKGVVAGGNENKLLAEALNAPEDIDFLQFLTLSFTSEELKELKQALHDINPLTGTKPVKPTSEKKTVKR